MGKRGPPPKPTRQKKLEGTFRPDRAPKAEFAPTPGAPQAPHWLDDEGRAEWDRIVPELAGKLLVSPLHQSSLADLCAAHSNAAKAQRDVQRRGLIIKTPFGPQKNPAIKIAQEARAQANLLRREFGLTPSAASRVRAPEKPDASDTTEADLFGRPGLAVLRGGKV